VKINGLTGHIMIKVSLSEFVLFFKQKSLIVVCFVRGGIGNRSAISSRLKDSEMMRRTSVFVLRS